VRRTQIYLDEQVDQQIRQRASAEGRSAAAVIREALDSYLARTPDRPGRKDPIRAMAGSVRGMAVDAAAEHDHDLYGPKAAAGRRDTR
jgi:hypothetical protein